MMLPTVHGCTLTRAIRLHYWWMAALIGGILITNMLIHTVTAKATDDITDEPAMKATVLHAVPISSTLTHATQWMTQEGFVCVPTVNADVVEQDRIYHHKDFLYCDRMDSAGFPIARRWQISLVYEQQRVTTVLVSSGLVGP